MSANFGVNATAETMIRDWNGRWRHSCPEEEDDEITIVYRSPAEHGSPPQWMLNPEDDYYRTGPISFCPWCGVKLPTPPC